MKFPPVALACFFVLDFAARLAAQTPDTVRKSTASQHQEVRLAEKDPSLAEVLADYSKLIGKQIITDNTVSTTTTLALTDLDGITPPQRANLIGKALFLNGYALVDADKDTVVLLGPGKNPRSVGVPLYTKPDELPVEERVFSYLFKLEHRDAIEIAATLQQFIPPGNDVNFTADVHGHTVIATGPTSVVRVVIKLVATMDAPGKTAE